MALQFNTKEANDIYIKLLDYFIMCDDPKYSVLHKFRNKILKIQDNEDRDKMINKFQEEARQEINYFSSPY